MTLFTPDLFAKSATEPASAVALGANQADVAFLARKCAAQLGFERGADLRPLVAKLGGSVKSETSLWSGDNPALEAIGNRFVIYVCEHTHPRRDRFDIAHALGHWVMHYQIPNQRDNAGLSWLRVGRYENSPANREANWFAFALLLPETDVRGRVAALGLTPVSGLLDRISDEFGVTTRHADLRLRGLGLIG